MNADSIKSLCERLDKLRRTLIVLEGENPDDQEEYNYYGPARRSEIRQAEKRFGCSYPASYKSFLEMHNGWLGFWPDWSLVGVPRDDSKAMYEDIENTVKLLPTVADKDTRGGLSQQEKVNPDVILITNHLVIGTDFNGSLLLLDGNRVNEEGEPEIAWVRYAMHVERRWLSFKSLLEEAIEDTEDEVRELQSET